MKRIILILAAAMAVTLSGLAQIVSPASIDPMAIEGSYSMVFDSDVPSKTKFLNTKVWVAKTFGDYKSVLQFEDEENNIIIVKGLSRLPKEETIDPIYGLPLEINPKMTYTISIDIKDDKYRVKIEDINIFSVWDTGWFETEQNQNIRQFCTVINRFDGDIEKERRNLDSLELVAMATKSKRGIRDLNEKRDNILKEIAELKVKSEMTDDLYKRRKETISLTLSGLLNSLYEQINVVDDF